MLCRILLLVATSLLVSAIPTPLISSGIASKPNGGPYAWSIELAAFYAAVSQSIEELQSSPGWNNGHPTCNLSKAQLPNATTALGEPDDGAVLKHVFVGTGKQNYTCPSPNNATAAPTAIGAYAYLFDASCVASLSTKILDLLPVIAYNYPLPENFFPASGTIGQPAQQDAVGGFSYAPMNILLSGLHTFKDLTTPQFNLDLVPATQEGFILAKKNSTAAAPSTAIQGTNGAVPWLKLNTISGTTDGFSNVYRVQTQGGMQPKTCGNIVGEFEVPYSALYWTYGQA